MRDFREAVNSGELILLDGGMGTLMAQLGGSMTSSENNTEHPDVVLRAHRQYIEAGSNANNTNTFSLNNICAAKSGLSQEEAEKSLLAAMEIAAEAAADNCWILGDIGPTGEMLAPLGKGDPAEFLACYERQAELMARYPLAAFIIETVFDMNEAKLAMEACHNAAPDIPVLLSMTYSALKRGGCTVMGHTAAKIAAAAEKGGAIAVGANCGDLTPSQYATILESYKEAAALPVFIEPNAGKPKLSAGTLTYPLDAAAFAEEMEACFAAGARIMGGCCGTAPAYIAALAERFGDRA
ncbi:MAG: homocysteine S-methyltransferase family protein [Firmicutes bacterium]|nr:homocysteine S-methyltransferase family protein [Bacillota bacterium]